jgi:hypothetical protein
MAEINDTKPILDAVERLRHQSFDHLAERLKVHFGDHAAWPRDEVLAIVRAEQAGISIKEYRARTQGPPTGSVPEDWEEIKRSATPKNWPPVMGATRTDSG